MTVGSFSALSSGGMGGLLIGVFHGTEISFTVPPSTDSVAEIMSSCATIGMRSPRSVKM